MFLLIETALLNSRILQKYSVEFKEVTLIVLYVARIKSRESRKKLFFATFSTRDIFKIKLHATLNTCDIF